jgi:hypothetical protein
MDSEPVKSIFLKLLANKTRIVLLQVGEFILYWLGVPSFFLRLNSALLIKHQISPYQLIRRAAAYPDLSLKSSRRRMIVSQNFLNLTHLRPAIKYDHSFLGCFVIQSIPFLNGPFLNGF